MFFVDQQVLPIVLILDQLRLFNESRHLAEVEIFVFQPFLLQTATEVAYFRKHLSQLRQHNHFPHPNFLRPDKYLRSLQSPIQRRNKQNINGCKLVRNSHHLASNLPWLCNRTVNVILIELELVDGRFKLKTASGIFQWCIIEFWLGVTYHKGLDESLVTVMAAAAESAPALHVILAFFGFLLFPELILHNFKLLTE